VNRIELLTSILAREGAESLGWEGGRPGGALARAVLQPAARRIAREFALLDDVLATRTLPDAARWALDHFDARVETAGLERVARRGPILLVANHPGLTDAVAIIAALDRDDVRIVAADYPFLRAMRGLAPRLIFLGANGTSQLSWVRAASRALRHGGVVLLFPAGRLEPDPAVLGHRGALLPWSESLALIARLAPETQVVPASVSGVLSARAFGHPLTRIRRTPRDRQRVATLLQMIDARYRRVSVRIAFGAPVETSADMSIVVAARMHDLLAGMRSDWTSLPPVPTVATSAA
jgi:1-acyl-sn-glycerol-3-phosphate acyltransferase